MRKRIKNLLEPVRVRNPASYVGALVKGYKHLKKTYNRYKTPHKINGRKVKKWKQVYVADDSDGDEFIPIFYKKKKTLLNKFEDLIRGLVSS